MATTRGGESDVMRSKWTVPVFSGVMGLVLLAALAAGHQLVAGLWSLGIMCLAGAAVLLGDGARRFVGCAATAATSGSRCSTCRRPRSRDWR